MRDQEAYIVYLSPSPLWWFEQRGGVADGITKAGCSERGHTKKTGQVQGLTKAYEQVDG